jgi:hypothetical protein
MPALAPAIRRDLEAAVLLARREATIGARLALEALAVHEAAPYPHMEPAAQRLRRHLRARAEQLGDVRTPDKRILLNRIVHECAYEHWHRMLFARFLAENDLLVEDSGVAITLDECRSLAEEEKTDLWTYASRLAQGMLPSIFRPGDPLLQVTFAREHRVKLEAILGDLDRAIFKADDSLGWVYQFWRAKEKEDVNKAGDKINADTLPAVTQLFTEHYMVEFLLHNTLGAWWTAKNTAAGRTSAIPLPYLRLKDDGSPAAGAFPGWPRTVRELRTIDPCCGSGHFLVVLFQLLVAMRREEEGLNAEAAVRAVLTDNLHGLEIDARCSQLAAFNVAFAGWRIIGRPVKLPPLHIACSGLAVGGTREEWLQTVESTGSELKFFLGQLYDLFKKAPDLGSLINPARLIGGSMHADKLEPLLAMLDTAFANLDSSKRVLQPEDYERGVTAQGLARAAQLLGAQYHLTVTNVPYLGRGKQGNVLRDYLEGHYPLGKADLATAFVLRCLEFCEKNGTAALVTPQNWLFLATYKNLREVVLEGNALAFIAELGPGAFQTPLYDFSFGLIGLTKGYPHKEYIYPALVASATREISEKASSLISEEVSYIESQSATGNEDFRILTQKPSIGITPLAKFAESHTGLQTGDNDRYSLLFWEILNKSGEWEFFQRTSDVTTEFGGMLRILRWEDGHGSMTEGSGCAVRGLDCRGRKGILVHRMGDLPATLYTGNIFDQNGAVIIPSAEKDLSAVWCYISSDEYSREVRKLDNKVGVTPATLVKVPFDFERWRKIASHRYPDGLPKPQSNNPNQWIFSGHPLGSTEPLQVAVARLLGYRWPRQTGSEFPDCPALGPDGLEAFADDDGIVCLSPIHGEAAAADRLQGLLAAAYGNDWSPAHLETLLTAADYGHKTLDDWLRDKFFEQHCTLFHQRPFIWHIWDGHPRGFSALVNYHQLAAAGGAGRKRLEKLTYTYLGDWISRQTEGVRNGTAGAADRLAAAQELKTRLVAIIAGEPPFDLFARWKPLHEQPIGWEPDVNDGVRVNIRPFMASDLPGGKRDAGILRIKPNVKWDKDRGKEPRRLRDEFPWFWAWDESSIDFLGGDEFTGDRWNACHYTTKAKHTARAAKEKNS